MVWMTQLFHNNVSYDGGNSKTLPNWLTVADS